MDDGNTQPIPAAQLLRREGRPLPHQVVPVPPAPPVDRPGQRRRILGAAAGALLAAGTLAGALGFADSGTETGRTDAAGDNSAGIEPSGVASPADAPRSEPAMAPKVDVEVKPTAQVKNRPAPQPRTAAGDKSADHTAAPAAPSTPDRQQQPPAPRQDAPTQQPAPATTPPSQDQREQSGPVGDILTPVTDTVDDTVDGVTDTVDGVLQPALTLIDPLGDLLGR